MKISALGLTAAAILTAAIGWYVSRPEPEWQSHVLSRLKDPESAQFRNVVVDDVTNWVCGEVNSKNSLGGYAGFERFMVQPPAELSREEWAATIDLPYRSTWKVTFEDDYAAVIGSCSN